MRDGEDRVDVTGRGPFGHDEALRLQRAELGRTVSLLRTLPADAWSRPVPECPGWDVLTMYRHVLGACEGSAPLEGGRQLLQALRRRRRTGVALESGLSATQIAARAALTPEQLVDRLGRAVEPTIRNRRRLPGFVRKVRIAVDAPVVEKWSVGYLAGTIYLRDLWMHRVDACRATGAALELTADHDGRIVVDVVAEWARRHGQPCTLELTGPAGGSFRAGPTDAAAASGAPHLELDAVEFCRTLAGRAPAEGLLATVVPF